MRGAIVRGTTTGFELRGGLEDGGFLRTSARHSDWSFAVPASRHDMTSFNAVTLSDDMEIRTRLVGSSNCQRLSASGQTGYCAEKQQEQGFAQQPQTHRDRL